MKVPVMPVRRAPDGHVMQEPCLTSLSQKVPFRRVLAECAHVARDGKEKKGDREMAQHDKGTVEAGQTTLRQGMVRETGRSVQMTARNPTFKWVMGERQDSEMHHNCAASLG